MFSGVVTNRRLAQNRPGPNQPISASGKLKRDAEDDRLNHDTPRVAARPAMTLTAPTMPGCGGTSECVMPRLNASGKRNCSSDWLVSRCNRQTIGINTQERDVEHDRNADEIRRQKDREARYSWRRTPGSSAGRSAPPPRRFRACRPSIAPSASSSSTSRRMSATPLLNRIDDLHGRQTRGQTRGTD